MALSPTQRSLKYLREQGYFAQVVEHWVPGANIRRDLFGGIDIVALRADRQGILGVQTTTRNNARARVQKILGIMELDAWMRAGNRIEVHGWDGPKLTTIVLVPGGYIK